MLEGACRTQGLSAVHVFSRIEQADAAVDNLQPDVVWTALELDDCAGASTGCENWHGKGGPPTPQWSFTPAIPLSRNY
ncbi:MAG UNVERIFIED_CONTAM: hypothetical protein LVR18_00210 [Planctomycetaceae bacterium]|jgi:hypothetical protein